MVPATFYKITLSGQKSILIHDTKKILKTYKHMSHLSMKKLWTSLALKITISSSPKPALTQSEQNFEVKGLGLGLDLS